MSGKEVVLVLFLLANLAVALCFSSCHTGREQVQREAIKAGCAEWVPGADGLPEFRWKAPSTQGRE